MTRKARIGPISEGTLWSNDLIEAFLDELGDLDESAYERIRDEFGHTWNWTDDDFESENAYEMVNALIDALNEQAPAFCYFGSTEGDGADFGFWPIDIQDIQRDSDVLTVSDLAEVPENPQSGMYSTSYVLLVNDHGNCTLYSRENGELTEVWSIV